MTITAIIAIFSYFNLGISLNNNGIDDKENRITFTLIRDTIQYNHKIIDMQLFEQKALLAAQQGKKIYFNYDESITVEFGERLKQKLSQMKVKYYGLD